MILPILFTIAAITQAPNEQTLFLRALAQRESTGNIKAWNRAEDACGLYQIRRIYVDDVNKILSRKAYSYADRWDKTKSEQMILVYLRHYATARRLGHPPTWFDCARLHNGGSNGHKKTATIAYANDVIRRMK